MFQYDIEAWRDLSASYAADLRNLNFPERAVEVELAAGIILNGIPTFSLPGPFYLELVERALQNCGLRTEWIARSAVEAGVEIWIAQGAKAFVVIANGHYVAYLLLRLPNQTVEWFLCDTHQHPLHFASIQLLQNSLVARLSLFNSLALAVFPNIESDVIPHSEAEAMGGDIQFPLIAVPDDEQLLPPRRRRRTDPGSKLFFN